MANLRQFLLLIVPPMAATAVSAIMRRARVARSKRPARVRFKYGEFFVECDASHHLPHILAVWPDFGRPLAEVVRALNLPQPCVIDVGANIGDTAVLLARFAAGARVLCIEGNDAFMSDLKLNTAQISGVTIARAALADRTGEMRATFLTRANHGGTASLVLQESGDMLHVRTLDDLLRDYPQFANPDVIKIDTDGFDPAILRGAAKTLETARPVAFYEWDPCSYDAAGEDDSGHADFMMAAGYDQFLIFTNTGQPLLRIHKPAHEVWESLGNFARARRTVDGWHYDIAAFAPERAAAGERLWQCYVHASSSRPDA